MTEVTSKVVERLKTYTSKKRRIGQLYYELENLPIIDDSEVIESFALGARPDGQGYRHGGHPSDKTMAIALQYKNIKREFEDDLYWEIKRELRTLESEVNRLEHYVSLLGNHEMDAIRLLFFERITWDEATQRLNISRQTLSRHRNSAIKGLAVMYSTLTSVASKQNTGRIS